MVYLVCEKENEELKLISICLEKDDAVKACKKESHVFLPVAPNVDITNLIGLYL